MSDRIAELASRQHGLVTRSQLLETGMTARVVNRWLSAGRLRGVHRGVYLASAVAGERVREMAAVLACGPGARASHRSAAWLWELGPRPEASSRPDVKIPYRRVVRRPGIGVHRGVDPASEPMARVDGVPVTAPLTTILDLTGVAGARELERAVARAERRGLVTLDQLGALVADRPRLPGRARLVSLLSQAAGPGLKRSELEERFASAVERYGLPRPGLNVIVHGREIDAYWAEARMAVELDGRAYHASWRNQREDRRRDGELAAVGIHVLRVTWQEVVHDTGRTMVRVGQALAICRDRLERGRGS